MPRRLLRHPEHDRKRTLWITLWWLETFTVHGPGDVQGEPTRLVDEFAGFVADCYAIHPTSENGNNHRLYDSAFFSRPKGCDKSGFAAKLALLEAFGPCRWTGEYAKGGETYTFLGQTYVYEPGEPMAREVATPYIRIMATEEGQTGNVYDVVYFNLTSEDAPLYAMRAYGADPGLTRVILPNGGEITPSTAGAASKDGGKETFVVFDESHLYVTPSLRQMYSTVTRNLRKRKRVGTWFIETTTMYAPGQESIAEQTYHLADSIEQGKAKRNKLLFDHRWGDIKNEDMGDELLLRAAVQEAYGDALSWNSLEGIVDGIFDPREAPEDSKRYFLNALTEARNAWLQPVIIDRAINRSLGRRMLEPGDVITLGFDGSKTDDATALVACRVDDRLLVPLRIDEVPDGPEAKDWQVDREAFDAEVANAFKLYEVVGFYGDPPHWQDYLDAWAREYGDDLRVHASGKHSIEWWTNRDIPMVNALERLHTAFVVDGTVMMSGRGSEFPVDAVLKRHFLNARKWPRRTGTVIGKDRRGSAHKMDGAMAATLAFEAAADFVAKPLPKKPSSFVPVRVR